MSDQNPAVARDSEQLELLNEKYRSALETLSGCFPERLFVYGAYGEKWSDCEPDPDEYDEYETIDFKELLGDANA